jgi:hypothetical protein
LEGEEILLRRAALGALGDETIIGDALDILHPGEKAFNLTYDDLAAAKAGVLIIDGDTARIANA